MTEQELDRAAEQETSWLQYYGHDIARRADSYNDVNFYDRINSIGYCKKVIPLWMRCPKYYITSDKPVLESSVDELIEIHEYRDHSKNIYTPLEFVLARNHGRHEFFRSELCR